MSLGHRPKMFRHPYGCCICETKTSSSRFTSSKPYEKWFMLCFGIVPVGERSGWMCNACVLLCKRHIKSDGIKTYERYVGCKSAPRGRGRRRRPNENFLSVTKKVDIKYPDKGRRIKSKPKKCVFGVPSQLQDFELSEDENLEEKSVRVYSTSSYIDLKCFLPTKICCGIVFINKYSETIIDDSLIRLWQCKNRSCEFISTKFTCDRSYTITPESGIDLYDAEYDKMTNSDSSFDD